MILVLEFIGCFTCQHKSGHDHARRSYRFYHAVEEGPIRISKMIRSSEFMQFGWLFGTLLRLSAQQSNTNLGMLCPEMHTGGNKGLSEGLGRSPPCRPVIGGPASSGLHPVKIRCCFSIVGITGQIFTNHLMSTNFGLTRILASAKPDRNKVEAATASSHFVKPFWGKLPTVHPQSHASQPFRREFWQKTQLQCIRQIALWPR